MGKTVQSVFKKDGTVVVPKEAITGEELRRKTHAKEEIDSMASTRAVCPYCLYQSTLNKFMTITLDFKVSKILTCPVCDQKFKQGATQIYDKGPIEYSKWFWDQIYFFDGRDKVKFDTVKQVARDEGFSTIFWNIQKEVKARKQGNMTSTRPDTKI